RRMRGIENNRSGAGSQVLGIFGIAEQSTARRFDQLGERAMSRLNHGDAIGQGLQDVEPLRLAINGRDREYVEALKELDLREMVRRFDVFEGIGQAALIQTL